MSDIVARSVKATTHGRVLVRRGPESRGVLLGFHGYYENADVQLERLLQIPGIPEWTLVAVQGLHRFYRARSEEVVASWMTRQDREVAIADNVRYVDAVLDSVVDARPAPPIVCAGFSQGAAMAFRAGVLCQNRSAGIIAVGGEIPPELLEDRNLHFPPVLLARGARDEYYTQAQIDRDAAALRTRGGEVQILIADAAHDWTVEVSREAGHFLRRFRA